MIDFKIQLPCTFEAIEVLEESVKPVLLNYVSSSQKIQFVIHELLINSYEATINRYGEEKAANYLINLELRRVDTNLEVSVCDQAGGILQSKQPKCTLDSILHDERGRGLLLVANLVDDLDMQLDDHGMFTIKVRKEGEFING